MSPSLKKFESKFMKFDTLMQFRVKRILLVSSLYDSFVLEEDGKLTDLIYNEYLEHNLTISPHVRRVFNAREALEVIENQDIDLVLIFKRVSDIDIIYFGQRVKNLKPAMPVILLAYDERDLEVLRLPDAPTAIDMGFIWTGDVQILLAIIKLVEDRYNVDHDTKQVAVRVIILVEDSVKFYSSYLPLLYSEIMEQTRALMAEGLNITDKLLRMRARPKILLATNYEKGWELSKKFKKYLLAVISDFRFPRHNEMDDEAGLDLAKKIREEIPDIPIIMQSSDKKNEAVANENNLGFFYKKSQTLHNDLKTFIMKNFGFGDFEFTTPEGKVLERVSDFKSMEKCLEKIDESSLLFHGYRNHFSNWLMARTEFDLAARLRPRKVSEFKDTQTLRQYLIDTFKNFRHEKQLGIISDFSRRQFDLQSDFVRIGGGSLGGKGRGLAFINALLHNYKIYDHFKKVRIAVPPSVILGTDVFDDFIESNKLLKIGLSEKPDEVIADEFIKAKLPKVITADLESILSVIEYPLAVRSSSMLEDSHMQPFAGIYDTHMLTNSHQNRKVRLKQLEAAIKTIFASTYFKNAKVYHESSDDRIEEEKMAVIIQQAVGRRYGNYFYPGVSGVGLSYNYYSTYDLKPEDGIVYVALGLGKTIVDGMNCLRFSPESPDRLPQFPTIKDLLKHSQHYFYAIDMSHVEFKTVPGGDENLVQLPITNAEEDGTLAPVCSTYSTENDRIYNGSSQSGIKVVTFAPILKSGIFPLSDIMKFLLKLGSQSLNCPVEIEMAVNLSDDKEKPHEFNFLQIRPMMKDAQFETVSLDDVNESKIIIKSDNAMGNIFNRSIQDIVFVIPESFDRSKTVKIAEEIGHFNQLLKEKKKPYLLIGPGRWGSSERWLGIPVNWNQISGSSVIVEAAYGDFAPEPSFGTHFMQNIVSFQMGYLTVNKENNNGFIDFGWLLKQMVIGKTDHVIHVSTGKPIKVLIDGRIRKSLITR